MRTSRRNPKISAFEELSGAFDYSKTPMSILGTRTLACNTPKARATWESHGEDGFYVGPCYFHYRLIEHFITATRSYRKTQSARFYPTHCRMPTILEANKWIMAAIEMLKLLQIVVPLAGNKCRRIKFLSQLTLIMSGGQSQSVETSTPPRVVKTASTSHNTRSPRAVQATEQIHQRVACSSTPMPSIIEVKEQPSKEDEQEIQQQLIN